MPRSEFDKCVRATMAIFESKPLGELFVKTKRPKNDNEDGLLNLWGFFLEQ